MESTHPKVSSVVGPIKISVVTTVLNEGDTIHSLIESLLNQTRKPDELIVVDAGSTDQTLAIVQEHQKTADFPIRALTLDGTNRSQGRNQGIAAAAYDYIAVIDAGCEADHSWLKHIAAGFQAGYDAVAGFYLSSVDKPIQNLFVPFLAVSPHRLNVDTFLPSSRSLGFTRQAWKTVGTYPEYLPTCEDLVFASQLKARTSMVVEPKALVYWHVAPGIPQFFKQIAGYTYGDVLAGYRPHIYKILSMWSRYAAFILLPPLFIVYLLLRVWMHREYIHRLASLPWYMVVAITADMAVLWGSFQGWVRLLRGFGQDSVSKEHS